MAKINICNPNKFDNYKFAVNYEPFSVKYLGSNPELSNKNVHWSVSNSLLKAYRISLMLDSETEPGDFVGKFRVIIHSLETDYSRVKFLTQEQIEDLKEFGRVVSLEVSNMEYRNTNNLPF